MRLRKRDDEGRRERGSRPRKRPQRRSAADARKGSDEAAKRAGSAKRPSGIAPGLLAAAAGLLGPLAGVLREALAIAREMLRIPAGIYMAVAERAGQLVLAAWRLLVPVVLAALALGRAAVRFGARTITPLRATLLAATAVALLLAGSQFAEYTSTQIGTEAYAEVDSIAPPPEVNSERAGDAHAWLGLPIAALALVGVALCARRRRAGALLLAALGIATVALSLLGDMPKGLDEGDAAIAYEGAEATLQGGFWAQLAAGALLVALAPLAALYAGRGSARPRRERSRRTARARRARPRPTSPVAEG